VVYTPFPISPLQCASTLRSDALTAVERVTLDVGLDSVLAFDRWDQARCVPS